MSSLASRPQCVDASHLHIVQWTGTWCSAAPAPRWQITILHYRRKSSAQIPSPCHAGGLPQWRFSTFFSPSFFILGICVRFHLSWKKKKLNGTRSPESCGLLVWEATRRPFLPAPHANQGRLRVLETPSRGSVQRSQLQRNVAPSLLVAAERERC